MITKAYAVTDKKAAFYGTPFFCASHGIALRMFADAVNDPKSTLYRHPEDFDLYCIGEFDDNSGELSGVKPEFISKATEHVPVKPSS